MGVKESKTSAPGGHTEQALGSFAIVLSMNVCSQCSFTIIDVFKTIGFAPDWSPFSACER